MELITLSALSRKFTFGDVPFMYDSLKKCTLLKSWCIKQKKYLLRKIVLIKSRTRHSTVISSSFSRPHESLTVCKANDSTFIYEIFKTGCCSLSVGQHCADKANPVIVLYQIIHMSHINHSDMPDQSSDKKPCMLLTVAVGTCAACSAKCATWLMIGEMLVGP